MSDEEKQLSLEKAKDRQVKILDTSDKIRPEYNISKFASFLFISPHSKQVREARRFNYVKKIDDEEVQASILVEPLKDHKTPTVTDQKVLYALFQIWEEQGRREDGVVVFSGREVAKILDKPWSGQFSKRLSESIKILRSTSISWRFSYETKNDLERKIDDYSILSNATYYERIDRLKREKFTVLNTVTFNKVLLGNLLEGKTKPFLLKEMVSIKTESAISLYTALDVYLSGKSKQREISAIKLFRDILYLDGERYEKRFIRKQELQKLVKALNGKRISSGGILHLTIRESADKSDWVLVVRALKTLEGEDQKKGQKRALMKPVNDDAEAQILVEDIRQALGILGEDEPLMLMAKHYSYNLINHALGVYKADYRGKVKNPIGLFQGILHGLAHKSGKEWIFGCDKDCKHRPENSPQQQLLD